MLDTIMLGVVITLLVIDRWVGRAAGASQREEWQSAFREGGRAYLEGYKIAYREFKQRGDDGE